MSPIRAAAALLAPAKAGQSFPDAEITVLVEDAANDASLAFITPTSAGTALTLSPPQPALSLASPIDVMFNLLPFSRGKTVPSEVLGSGNPVVTAQDFVLKNTPVTYFADPASVSGDGFSSTVQVSVNNVAWREAQSFYGQPRDARVFVLHEDDSGQTHVTFGDGVNGALLPTGTNNVVATYRYGAGAAAPAVETLTVIQSPQPGLKALRNPLQPTGGADADDPNRLKTLAPQSVLTFGRAVAKDDYVAIALTAGADRAAAAYVFDPVSQRPKVTLWVAGDANAVASAKQAVACRRHAGPGPRCRDRDARRDDAVADLPLRRRARRAGDPDRAEGGAHRPGCGPVRRARHRHRAGDLRQPDRGCLPEASPASRRCTI